MDVMHASAANIGSSPATSGSPPGVRAAPAPRGAVCAPATSSPFALASRVAAAVLGGYAFAWGLVATATSLCVAAGMGFHDAEFLSSLLGVLAYLAALLWAMAARRLWPAWLALAGGGALLAGAGSLVQAALT